MTIQSFVALCSASVLVLSVAIGPFTQQTIRAVACEVISPDDLASVPVAEYLPYQTDVSWSIYGDPFYGSKVVISPQMSIAALRGIVGSPDQVNAIPVSCPTGNCDFPGLDQGSVSYSSLAICSSCVDISEHIFETYQGSNDDFIPGYWSYNVSDTDPSYLGIQDTTLTTGFYCTGCGNKVLNIQALEQDDGANDLGTLQSHSTYITSMSFTWAGCAKPIEFSDQHDWLNKMHCSSYWRFPGLQNKADLVAANSSLDLCVRKYESKVRSGELQEKTISINKDVFIANTPPLADGCSQMIIKSPCFMDGQRYDITNLSQVAPHPGRNFTALVVNNQSLEVPLDCVFSVKCIFIEGISAYMRDLFNGYCVLNKWSVMNPREWIACDERWWYKSLFNQGNASLESVSAAFENIALEITARMRTTGMNAYGTEPGRAVGIVTRSAVCIEVYWPWLTLHIFLVALTGIVFALVLYDSRRQGMQPIWKHSSLVPFFHGLRDEQQRHGTIARAPGPVELSMMEEAAAKMDVKLEQCKEGYGFVLSGTSEEVAYQSPSSEHLGMRLSTDTEAPDVLGAPELGPRFSESVAESLNEAH